MMMEVDNIVKSLNIKLMEMAKLCFENDDVTLFHKECGSLSSATLNISNACLELVDGAIVVMGMLQSITEQQSEAQIFLSMRILTIVINFARWMEVTEWHI